MLNWKPCRLRDDCFAALVPQMDGRPRSWVRVDRNPNTYRTTAQKREGSRWRMLVVVRAEDMPGSIKPPREIRIYQKYTHDEAQARALAEQYVELLLADRLDELESKYYSEHKWKAGLIFDRDEVDGVVRCLEIHANCTKTIPDPWAQGIHVDHKLARTKGGGHDIGNLQLLCKSCNSSKGNRPRPSAWAAGGYAEQLATMRRARP